MEVRKVEGSGKRKRNEVTAAGTHSKVHRLGFRPKDKSRNCPYLDTINRNVLDFDFEKLCSVSLSRINVYACLVCGKYFQGRGPNTHAYMHSVQAGHHVFLNLQTLRFYCIPDNYEIIDSSLDDITYVLKPTFTLKEISGLDTNDKLSRAYNGTTYMPGIVGLNNIKANDYCNVILQALSHVPPLRNYFLREESYATIKRPPGDTMFLLVQRFGELLRKLWNPRNFKAHVSPHEMLQAVVLCSKKKFQITEQVLNCFWFNFTKLRSFPLFKDKIMEKSLQLCYLGSERKDDTAYGCNDSCACVPDYLTEDRQDLTSIKRILEKNLLKYDDEIKWELELDILLSDMLLKGDPIVFLSWFLNSLHIALNGSKKANSSIVYLAFRGAMRIYTRTIIPIDKTEEEKKQLMKNEDYKEHMEESSFLYLTVDLPPPPLFKDELRENIIPQVPLFSILAKFNGTSEKEYKSYKDSKMKRFEITTLPPYLILYIKRFTKNTFFIEKNNTIVNFPIKNVDLTELLHPDFRDKHPPCVYDLIANIVHDGEPGSGKGTYRIHILHRGSGKWYEMQDLHVTEILPQMITLSEAYIQIWERRRGGSVSQLSSK